MPVRTETVSSESPLQNPETHVITGGGGFPGFSLGKKLVEEGHRVKLLDIKEPVWDLLDGMEFVKVKATELLFAVL